MECKNVCSICGRSDKYTCRRRKFGNVILCGKHNAQMNYKGRILNKTYKDANDVNFYNDYVGIVIRNKSLEVVGESFVSLDKYNIVKNYKWCLTNFGYAKTGGYGKKQVLMHKLIFNEYPDGLHIDHINGNKLDNRNENIRFCTKAQNAMNSISKWKHTKYKTKGVSFDKRKNRYRAYIKINQKQVFGGYFKTEEDAVNARIILEQKYFKEYARCER